MCLVLVVCGQATKDWRRSRKGVGRAEVRASKSQLAWQNSLSPCRTPLPQFLITLFQSQHANKNKVNWWYEEGILQSLECSIGTGTACLLGPVFTGPKMRGIQIPILIMHITSLGLVEDRKHKGKRVGFVRCGGTSL
jgi:hypothetical protein